MVPSVAVVGAGISGVSAARVLQDRGVDVVVLDRGHRVGGRMAARTLRDTGLPYDGRVVDLGAAYLTADEPLFLQVVRRWQDAGLLRPWTDTFHVAGPDGISGTTTGPTRFAAPQGLRSLVEDLAADLRSVVNPRDVEGVARAADGVLVDGEPFDAVILAMPDPQARDLLDEQDPAQPTLASVEWLPTLALTSAYAERTWPELDAVFVNDRDDLLFIADDGRRRGDGAPVLVAHAHPTLARRHLDDPAGAAPDLVRALHDVLGFTTIPAHTEVKRWSLARPGEHRRSPYWFDGRVGICGDAWGATPRVQTAWMSGRFLGDAVASALGR